MFINELLKPQTHLAISTNTCSLYKEEINSSKTAQCPTLSRYRPESKREHNMPRDKTDRKRWR